MENVFTSYYCDNSKNFTENQGDQQRLDYVHLGQLLRETNTASLLQYSSSEHSGAPCLPDGRGRRKYCAPKVFTRCRRTLLETDRVAMRYLTSAFKEVSRF